MFQFKFDLKGLLLGMVSLACLVAFAGPVKAQVPKDTVEAIKSKGEILIGVRNDFPPIGSVDGRGNPIGFGIDLGNAIADALGVKAKFVAVTSRTRFPLLKQGSIDIEIGVAHRIENIGTTDLLFTEVQTGTYFGEDDIERLEDDFGRS